MITMSSLRKQPIPLSAIELEFMMDVERSDEEYPDYLLPNLDPSLQSMLEDEPELLETHPEWFRDELYERFVVAAEENPSDLYIWDEPMQDQFYDYHRSSATRWRTHCCLLDSQRRIRPSRKSTNKPIQTIIWKLIQYFSLNLDYQRRGIASIICWIM